MQDERWQRVEALYHSALKLPTEQRIAFLEDSCGEDTSLRNEVESLVARYSDAKSFMEAPAFEVAARQMARDENKHPTDLAEEFVPGNLLAGRYRIATLLGRGGMGAVYRADDLDLGQAVALKFLPRAYSQDARRLERFRAEVRNARRISHPSVCRVYDIHEADGLQFLTMEYIDGEDLQSLLRRIGHLQQDKALQIARQLCAGLTAAHAKDVLHRDLKPSNIMIDGQGHARITDFGLAVNFDDVRELRETAGTPAYMAPEQLDGKPATVKSDLYSLGLVLYELYTGNTAIDGGSLAGWKHTFSQLGPVPPSVRVGDIDKSVERIILQCLEQDPNQRPSSALKVAAALPGGDLLAEAIAAGETPSPEMVAAAEEPALRVRTAWAALAGTLVLLATLAVIASRSTLQGVVSFSKDRSVLIEQAQKIIQQAGYTGPFADHEEDYVNKSAVLAYWTAKAPDSLAQALNRYPGSLVFWYRASARSIRPIAPYADVNFDQPPLDQGSVRVSVTSQGQLLNFLAIPGQAERETSPATAVEWPAMFDLAGLPMSRFHAVPANHVPPAPFDARFAWEGNNDEVPLRVQAASLSGRLVSFNVSDPRTQSGLGTNTVHPLGPVFFGAQLFGILFMSVLGGIFAYRNFRKRRGDRHGAVWIFVFVFGLAFLEYLGLQHFSTDANAILGISVINGAGVALFLGAVAMTAYLAAEPFVRRHWPHLLISWSRIVSGDYRNPIVGRDLLMGVITGCIAAFIVHAAHVFPPLTAPMINVYPWFSSAKISVAIGQFLSHLRFAVDEAMAGIFFLVLLRKWLRSEALAIVLTSLILAMALPASGIGVWWLVYPADLVAAFLCVLVAARLGLLSAMVAMFTESALVFSFTAIRWSDWNVARPLLLLGLFAALAIYGFRIAVARPMLTTALDE
jgi:Protein kinase domain